LGAEVVAQREKAVVRGAADVNEGGWIAWRRGRRRRGEGWLCVGKRNKTVARRVKRREMKGFFSNFVFLNS